MEFFTNLGIREAVQLSQSKNAVFFVAILGSDQQSQEFVSAMSTPEVRTLLSSDNFVCIRLEGDSEQHRLFSDIYANAKSPSIYCITDKGVPVEIITNSLSASELKDRLESALTRHRQVLGLKPVTPVVPPNTSTAQSNPTSSNVTVPETSSVNNAESSGTSSSPTDSSVPFEERVRRAKELAAARQLLKQKEEEEERKKREIERRQAGKGAAELKRWQDEQEAKKILEERKKDREDEKALRQRLREQIAQDRAVRNARTNVELVEQSSASSSLSTPTPASKPSTTTNTSVNYAGQARLQFRLPDGSSKTSTFDPDSTLGHVRQYLRDNNVIPFREFAIWVAFPRKQFSETDYGTSLRELGLLPSAALLILPLSGLSMNPEAARNSGLWALIATLLGFVVYPITLVWSVFQRALPSSTPQDKPQNTSSASSTAQPEAEDKRLHAMGKGKALGSGSKDQSTSGSTSSAPSSDNPSQAQSRKKSKGKGPSTSTSQPSDGIHRLRSTEKEGESDEEKFYNGNSTQQM